MPKVVWTIDGDARPLERKLKKTDALAEKTGSKLQNLGGKKGGGGGGGFAALGARALPFAAIAAGAGVAIAGLAKMGGQRETTRIQFQTLLGSAEKGNRTLEQLAEFANSTPFSNEEVNQAGKTLLAFDVRAEDLSKRMRMLGDISAGTGKSFKDVAEIFGRIKQNGRLMGEELNRLIDGGFNPLGIISEKTGKSVSQLRKEMSKGLITFDMVDDAFKTATSEGGKYFQMTQKLSESFEGKLSTALGKGNFLIQKIGEKTLPLFTAALDGVIGAIDWLDDTVKRLRLSALTDSFNDVWVAIKPVRDLLSSVTSDVSGLTDEFNVLQVVIDGQTILWKTLLLPMKGFIRLGKLLIGTADNIKAAFSGLSDIIDGAFELNPTKIAEGFKKAKNQIGGGIDEVLLGLEDFGRQEAKEYADILKNFGRLQDKEGSTGGTNLSSPGAGVASSSVQQPTSARRTSVGGGISGGGGVRNLQVDIGSLVENVTFDSTGGESEAELQDRLTRVLVGAVNNFERLAGG